jgi:hypothetical protein
MADEDIEIYDQPVYIVSDSEDLLKVITAN